MLLLLTSPPPGCQWFPGDAAPEVNALQARSMPKAQLAPDDLQVPVECGLDSVATRYLKKWTGLAKSANFYTYPRSQPPSYLLPLQVLSGVTSVLTVDLG